MNTDGLYGLWENPLRNPRKPVAKPPSRQEQGEPPTAKADFHFLYLAPGLDVAYFFDAAKKFWQTFKVIVIHDIRVIQHVPRQYSVAITSLARSDTAQVVREQIESTFGVRVYHDPLVYDFIEDLQLTLDARAERNEPFGVPLDQQ
ncbi:MAG TPA: hypothetical protein VJZ27_04330 [Aggregatilineales bacterium]|nr:hypothetical protein [Aggregatilineales bacterium]